MELGMSPLATIATPVAPPANAAIPGTEQPAKVKKTRNRMSKAKLSEYVLSKDTDGNPILLTAVPEDYSSDKFAPLKKDVFVSEVAYLEYVASVHDQKAAAVRAQIETLKKLGTGAAAAQAKKFLQMRADMARLEQMLRAQGVDMSSLDSVTPE